MCVPNGCSPRLRAGRSIELADSKFLGPGPASFDDVQLPGGEWLRKRLSRA